MGKLEELDLVSSTGVGDGSHTSGVTSAFANWLVSMFFRMY